MMTGNNYQKEVVNAKRNVEMDDRLFTSVQQLVNVSTKVNEIIKGWWLFNHNLESEMIVNQLSEMLLSMAVVADAIGADMDGLMTYGLIKLKNEDG
jgi:hypothetical protein